MARKVAILPPLFAIVAVALALVVVGLWPSGQAAASGHSATRVVRTILRGCAWGRGHRYYPG